MSAASGLFREMITATLASWHSFQVSVEAGMGGSNTQEKLGWMVDVIEELFATNASTITPDDVEEYLSEVLDNEFETVIQDGSLEMVCTNLCSCHHQISTGNLDFVREKVAILVNNASQAKLQRQQEADARRAASQAKAHSNEVEMGDAGEGAQPDDGEHEEEDDGWTTVGRTRRR